MEWIVQNAGNPEGEKSAAKFPQIRMFTVQKAPSETLKDDCVGTWQVCSPETAGTFSAVGYFFSRELHQN
jgi:sialate O-acetylesterase